MKSIGNTRATLGKYAFEAFGSISSGHLRDLTNSHDLVRGRPQNQTDAIETVATATETRQ